MSVILYNAFVEITNICNLNCITCYNRSGLNSTRQEISLDAFRSMIERLLPLGCRKIILAGGEPCLHKEFDQLLELTSEFPQISFGITTNGTVFNEKLIETYQKVESFFVQISLDGSNEELNARTRGKNNFEKALKLIKSLSVCGKKPTVKMVVSQSNLSDIESFYRFAAENNAIPEFAFICKCGNGMDDWEQKMVHGKQKLSVLKTVSRLNEKYKTQAKLPYCSSNCPLDEPGTPMAVAIKADGALMPCQMLYDPKFEVCNIFNFTVDALESGFDRIIKLAVERKGKDFNCTSCILRSICNKGCMAMADYFSGDPFGDDGDCEFRKLQFLGHDLSWTSGKVAGRKVNG